MKQRTVLAALLFAGLAVPARGAELYGRPLRGLTPIPIAELREKAAAFDGKTIRVRGDVLSKDGDFLLKEGEATLKVTMRDPAVTLPGDAGGAKAVAEGVFRSKGPGGGPFLEATGLELTR